MKVKVLLIWLVASFLLHSEAFISINIDPEDLDRVSDFFHSIVINQEPETLIRSPQHRVISFMKKTIYGTIQIFSIIIALVGANVISSNLVPAVSIEQKPEIIFNNQKKKNSTGINPKYAGKCDIDFGCHKNICWRSCYTNVYEKKFWCYASPNPLERKFQRCNITSDCSLCWECLEKCHT